MLTHCATGFGLTAHRQTSVCTATAVVGVADNMLLSPGFSIMHKVLPIGST